MCSFDLLGSRPPHSTHYNIATGTWNEVDHWPTFTKRCCICQICHCWSRETRVEDYYYSSETCKKYLHSDSHVICSSLKLDKSSIYQTTLMRSTRHYRVSKLNVVSGEIDTHLHRVASCAIPRLQLEVTRAKSPLTCVPVLHKRHYVFQPKTNSKGN